MAEIGYFLGSEEHGPRELVAYARAAEQAGFRRLYSVPERPPPVLVSAFGPKVGGLKVCWAADESAARKTAHELWRNEALPGQLGQELPTPAHFEQASQLVTEEMVAEAFPCGPDPERHVAAIRQYLDAGYEVVHVQQMGKDQAGFMDFHRRELAQRRDTTLQGVVPSSTHRILRSAGLRWRRRPAGLGPGRHAPRARRHSPHRPAWRAATRWRS
jgi:hypothetical protein